jgi:CheY-like chemotaxis protein
MHEGNWRILVAHNNKLLRNRFAALMNDNGFIVMEARNGNKAIDVLIEQSREYSIRLFVTATRFLFDSKVSLIKMLTYADYFANAILIPRLWSRITVRNRSPEDMPFQLHLLPIRQNQQLRY